RGWGAMGSVHRSLPAGTRKLAESGGTGDRPLFQAMFGEAPTRRDPDSPGGSPRLEPANQPKSRHDQLDIRSQESQKEVQIQVQHQAARDLARNRRDTFRISSGRRAASVRRRMRGLSFLPAVFQRLSIFNFRMPKLS